MRPPEASCRPANPRLGSVSCCRSAPGLGSCCSAWCWWPPSPGSARGPGLARQRGRRVGAVLGAILFSAALHRTVWNRLTLYSFVFRRSRACSSARFTDTRFWHTVDPRAVRRVAAVRACADPPPGRLAQEGPPRDRPIREVGRRTSRPVPHPPHIAPLYPTSRVGLSVTISNPLGGSRCVE